MAKAHSVRPLSLPVALLVVVLSSVWIAGCHGKTPDAELYLEDGTLYRASYGDFGSRATFGGLTLSSSAAAATTTTTATITDYDSLCNISGVEKQPFSMKDIVLVPRGGCSFELKAYNARMLGAAGVVIYNTLESRYGGNETTVLYPTAKYDYECANGRVRLDNVPFQLDPPAYQTALHDQYLVGDSPKSVCVMPTDTCASNRCLITRKLDDTTFDACCAWDLHVSMSGDAELRGMDTSDIICVFVTMEQGDQLLKTSATSNLALRPRHYPRWNASSLFLWAFGAAITAFAGWFSATDYRRARYKLANPQIIQEEVEMSGTPTVVSIPDHGGQEDHQMAEGNVEQAQFPRQETSETVGAMSIDSGATAFTATSNPSMHVGTGSISPHHSSEYTIQHDTQNAQPPSTPPQTPPTTVTALRPRRPRSRSQPSPRSAGVSMELTMWHAAGFVVVASILLLLLFFFQFYTAITILYGIGCSGATSQLIFRPLFSTLAQLLKCSSVAKTLVCSKIKFCGLGETTALDVVSVFSGYLLGAMWLYVGFTSDNPSTNPFYWMTQNAMGACICILFLGILRLNSIKVATVLLLAVFIYDIFFVFVTPYFFDGDSVMVTVATGGGPGDVSEDYCEKYPSDSECKRGQPLPLLLQIPRIGDFRGGSSLLGLGDIVLPGLLVSFGARLDDAKRLIGGHTSLQVTAPPRPYGYLFYLSLAYSIGLLMANLAVVLMQRGQPALLYLVPATLGTMVALGWHELGDLWKGPKVLVWADRLARYCDLHTFVASAQDAATVAESVEEEEGFELQDERERIGREIA